MQITFRNWLAGQEERQDNVGRLANALDGVKLLKSSRRRKPDEHLKWANAVVRKGRQEYVQAFNRAWQEYQAWREQREAAEELAAAD